MKNLIDTRDTILPPPEWEKIFSNHIFDKGLVSVIYKECLKFINKKTNSPTKNWAKDLNLYFYRNTFDKNHVKRWSQDRNASQNHNEILL